MALLLLALLPGDVLAAGAFPRGPGFYFHPGKFLAVLAVYLIWVRSCWWVDQDARALKQPTLLWNPLLLGGGLAGLLAVWVLPLFPAAFLILLVLCLAPALAYVARRNEQVEPARRVLTPRHLRAVARRWLRLGPGDEAQEPGKVIPIRFIGKSMGSREEDKTRVTRAQGSRGYQAALEMVHEAVTLRATDIHMEPTKEEMTVRFRVDGMLHPSNPFGRVMGDAVVNIFKVLADLDITEKRKPQDGSFSAEVQEAGRREGEAARKRQVDFRAATAGSVTGEKLVLRILDHGRQLASLGQLGMRGRMREQIHGLAVQPHGMLIVCGPTGAGKSTTLYACLSEIDRFQKNVITVENPVEFHLENVTQIEVNPKAGKTFATELRSILRQDPDVILIGEVRDHETAEIACQAAQTGHMVFTTLHANDTITALSRLLDLGVQPFLIASSVSAVLGQRLVRLLCPKCKQRYKPNADMLRKANLPVEKIKFFCRPPEKQVSRDGEVEKCAHCGGSGYRGRTGIFELLILNDRIRDLLRDNPNLTAIKQEAVKGGLIMLQEDGLRQVIEGETSIQELLRVCK
jgi:type II secretory ATPase GspE/PulE/Tfp pilus assembly ATPase PilB-like protein